MSNKFDDFMKELQEEARRGGPKALAEYAAYGAFYRLALEVFELRKARGLTQRQLGAKAGIQQAEISRIEAGNSNPTLSTIAALAQALGAELSLSPSSKAPRISAKSVAGRRHAPSREAARRVAQAGAR
jgi:transcriptional regulator with XRE-family HTH domain